MNGPRISVYVKNGINPNYRAFLLGADRVAAREGMLVTHRVPEPPDNVEQQMALLEADLENPPDAILFNPTDDSAMESRVAQATSSGIPIINFINRMNGNFVSFIGGDEFAIGYNAARHLLAAIGAKGNVVVIEGPESAPTARERARGFAKAIAECPNVIRAGTACGHYQKQGGDVAMTQLLASVPHIDGIIAANDLMALGAIAAMERVGRLSPIMGSNGTVEAAHAIKDGRLSGSVDYDGFKMGCIAMEAMLRHLHGETVPKEIFMPAAIITRANVAPWLVPVEERPIPGWDETLSSTL